MLEINIVSGNSTYVKNRGTQVHVFLSWINFFRDSLFKECRHIEIFTMRMLLDLSNGNYCHVCFSNCYKFTCRDTRKRINVASSNFVCPNPLGPKGFGQTKFVEEIQVGNNEMNFKYLN